MPRFRNPLNHPSVILRRQAVLAAGNYRAVSGFEDYELWLRLLVIHGSKVLANTPQPLVMARVGPAHLSRRHGWSYAQAEVGFFCLAFVSDCCPGTGFSQRFRCVYLCGFYLLGCWPG
jgi:hypothetical protein